MNAVNCEKCGNQSFAVELNVTGGWESPIALETTLKCLVCEYTVVCTAEYNYCKESILMIEQ